MAPWFELIKLVKEIGIEVVLPIIRELKRDKELERAQGTAAGHAASDASAHAGHPFIRCPTCGTMVPPQ